ncbi:endolysin [Gordonia phage Neville]|uniref:Lysin A, N-acetylmuramoyl-L-alanine amidase domain n=2 Tax=Nevillevirus TaxID=3044773 RepID=A0A515MGX1_9CAUD|nr:endolysin [Gordonia phage Neville]YP_010246020.1 endolysin [Gordonia phage Trax]AXQ64407.1 lysin A, N-acetylmuramoyl-L-alanine amidase domain [Gordonia phage Neville]QDM55922.1 lysin A, N-acetylmuramoyl-L-alanine amidase domain [Gordonia phage Trax]
MVENPITRHQISPNRHSGGRNVSWIVIHTQEGNGRAKDIIPYLCNPAPGGDRSRAVSYNAVVDDTESVLVVPWDQNPWSASNANSRGDHLLSAGSFARWTAAKWLETDDRDGKDENAQMDRLAKLTAYRCKVRGIPPVYVGGKGMPKTPGICGHVDFGAWGGGHTDPGKNFPWAEFIRRVQEYYYGEELNVAAKDEIIAFIRAYVGPIVSDVKDIRQQLTGGRDAGEYPGWSQLGQDEKGRNFTVVDSLGDVRKKVVGLVEAIKSLDARVARLEAK